MTTELKGGHELYECPGKHEDGGWTCMFCAGGLTACSRCGALEGAWPDDCPGMQMTYEQSEAVHKGRINYRAGAWRKDECCQVMRRIYDTENWMREHGYRPGDPAKNEGRWVKLHA